MGSAQQSSVVPCFVRGSNSIATMNFGHQCRDDGRQYSVSSAGEHFLDMEGVRGSIPLPPTIKIKRLEEAARLSRIV